MKILLADDDPVAQNILARQLIRIGLEVDVVSSGPEALHALQSRSYEVIFMDLQMPGMSGLETAHAIRTRWPHKCMKIIAVTGCLRKGCREICLQAGMDGYIAKPAKTEDILAYL